MNQKRSAKDLNEKKTLTRPAMQGAKAKKDSLPPMRNEINSDGGAAAVDDGEGEGSLIASLYGRDICLNKENEHSSLYAHCREWFADKPNNPNKQNGVKSERKPPLQRLDNGEELLEKLRLGEINAITALPATRKTDMSPIPPPLPKSTFTAEENALIANLTKEELLELHKCRWKQVKKHWIQHRRTYKYLRCGMSFEILDNLRDNQMQFNEKK